MSEIQDIKSEIAKLQEEIAKLKLENQALKVNEDENNIDEDHNEVDEKRAIMKSYLDELHNAVIPVKELFEKVFDEKKIEVATISTCISTAYLSYGSNGRGGGTSQSTSFIHSIDDINEEGMAAACEVFTNPRRIAVLKALFKEEHLTASEIGQRTGLAGGQLYHHLSALEAAELIRKNGDKYESDSIVLGLLGAIHAATGGMKIAKPVETEIEKDIKVISSKTFEEKTILTTNDHVSAGHISKCLRLVISQIDKSVDMIETSCIVQSTTIEEISKILETVASEEQAGELNKIRSALDKITECWQHNATNTMELREVAIGNLEGLIVGLGVED